MRNYATYWAETSYVEKSEKGEIGCNININTKRGSVIAQWARQPLHASRVTGLNPTRWTLTSEVKRNEGFLFVTKHGKNKFVYVYVFDWSRLHIQKDD